MKKKSFFERLTGGVNIEDYEEEEILDEPEEEVKKTKTHSKKLLINDSEVVQNKNSWLNEENHEGQLTVDVYQTPAHIIIKTMVAGVKREDLDISITRDIVTIKGKREEERNITESDYFHKELYWGTFSRTILLPHEIEIDGAEANENMGLLTIKLPKIDKERQTKLRVMKAVVTN